MSAYAKTLWTDIRFWIGVVFVVRLCGVSNPPLDRFDAWRQSITAMTTRSMLEGNANLFFPRIDFAGDLSGIVGMEFPIYNAITAVLVWVSGADTGSAEMIARLLNMGITSIGILYFYKAVDEFVSKDIALPAAVLLLCSLWMLYSRKIMPDTFAAGLGLVGTYHGLRYAENGARSALAKFFVWMSLAMLSKISVAFMLCYPPLLLFRGNRFVFGRLLSLTGAACCALVLVALWYFWWVPGLTTRFGFEHFFMGRPLAEGWSQIVQNGPETLERFTKVSIGYSGSVLLAIGLLSSVWSRSRVLIWIFVGGLVAFMPFVIKSGFNFFHHNYYVIPFVPVLCVLAAQGAGVLKQRGNMWTLSLVFAVFFLEQGARVVRDLNHKNDHLLTLSSRLDSVSERTDLILVNSGDDPTPMYFAHRKGWLAHNNQLESASYLPGLQAKGLRYVVLIQPPNGVLKMQPGLPVVYQDKYFVIQKLARSTATAP